jgi:hypothetical protein
MYFESFRADNVRHLEPGEHNFRAGRGAIRKWTVLEATEASAALVRCLALASLGRRQMQLCGRDEVVAGDATLAHSRRDTRFIQSDL